jgi:hypothetical protein
MLNCRYTCRLILLERVAEVSSFKSIIRIKFHLAGGRHCQKMLFSLLLILKILTVRRLLYVNSSNVHTFPISFIIFIGNIICYIQFWSHTSVDFFTANKSRVQEREVVLDVMVFPI